MFLCSTLVLCQHKPLLVLSLRQAAICRNRERRAARQKREELQRKERGELTHEPKVGQHAVECRPRSMLCRAEFNH